VDGNGNAFLAGFVEGHLDGNPSAGDADIFLAKFKVEDLEDLLGNNGSYVYIYICIYNYIYIVIIRLISVISHK
jgi:hypothetical protein